jgi:hypothetical protein
MADYRSDSQRMVDMTKSVRDVPQYEELMGYLSARRAVPPTQFRFLGDNTIGEYVRNSPFGNTLPRTGVIGLNRGAGPDTFVHELTHAAAAQLATQYGEYAKSWGEVVSPDQFTDGFVKLMIGSNADYKAGKQSPPIELAKKLDPTWAAKNKDYRATAGELLGFAVGNTVPTKSGKVDLEESRGPAHLDATLATDMMILLDLATRAQKAKPQSQGR